MKSTRILSLGRHGTATSRFGFYITGCRFNFETISIIAPALQKFVIEEPTHFSKYLRLSHPRTKIPHFGLASQPRSRQLTSLDLIRLDPTRRHLNETARPPSSSKHASGWPSKREWSDAFKWCRLTPILARRTMLAKRVKILVSLPCATQFRFRRSLWLRGEVLTLHRLSRRSFADGCSSSRQGGPCLRRVTNSNMIKPEW
jgi:hypothetical protein